MQPHANNCRAAAYTGDQSLGGDLCIYSGRLSCPMIYTGTERIKGIWHLVIYISLPRTIRQDTDVFKASNHSYSLTMRAVLKMNWVATSSFKLLWVPRCLMSSKRFRSPPSWICPRLSAKWSSRSFLLLSNRGLKMPKGGNIQLWLRNAAPLTPGADLSRTQPEFPITSAGDCKVSSPRDE